MLISLFRRWSYMECFLGLMEYLGCQRAFPREDYDVWEGQGSIAGQFAAGAHVIWALVYIPCLLELFFTQQVPLVKFKSIYNVHQNNQWRVMVITLMTTMTRMMMMMVMLIASTPLYATAHNQRAHPLCKDLLPKWVSCCFSFSYLLRLTTQALRSWSAWRTVIFFTFTWLPSKSCLFFV